MYKKDSKILFLTTIRHQNAAETIFLKVLSLFFAPCAYKMPAFCA